MFSNSDLRLLSFLLFPAASLASQPTAADPVEAPLRDLKLGQLNFLHTTDTHGWHAGHLLESSYSADWGDYISFTARLREKIEADGNDLIVVDTGDRVEGNGLYDASNPKGEYLFDIIGEQHIDVLASGNHELYKKTSAEDEYNIMVPKFKDNYVASNLDIIDPETGETVPLAPRYRRFTTKNHGIRIMAFGFLFDFTGNYNNTIVDPVEKAIQKDWFQDAIRDKDIDLFLVIGHSPLRGKEFDAIFKEIRKVKWDVPIQFFGGHLHVRDYKKFDSKSVGLASGRFMETIGFQSISGISAGGKTASTGEAASLSFARRYIDNNLYSYYHHTGLNESTFSTSHGLNLSTHIKSARDALDLDSTFGCAPQDLWMSRAKYPSNESIFSWLEEKVLPDVVQDKERVNASKMITINTGGVRFDILKGPFTIDSTFTVSPFTSNFRYIKDVPYEKALKILSILNNGGTILKTTESYPPPSKDFTWLSPPEQRHYTSDIIASSPLESPLVSILNSDQIPLTNKKPHLTPGYTTQDDDGNDGDDTIHSQISFYKVPNAIQSVVLSPSDPSPPETIDFVYIDFIQPWILLAFRFTGLEYHVEDTEPYMEGKNLTGLLAGWVEDNWKVNC